MSIWPVVAGLGGAASGANQAMQFYSQLDQKKQLQELRDQLAQIMEQGRNDRASRALDEKSAEFDRKQKAADLDRALRTTDITGRLENIGRANDLREQDINNRYDEFWGSTDPLRWAEYGQRGDIADQTDATRRYGIDTSAATTRRGQDVTASDAELAAETSQRNADLASATSQRNTNANVQRPRAKSNILELLNAQFPPGTTAAPAAAAPPAPDDQPYTPPATVQPPAHVTRAPVPVKPRGAAAAPGPAAPSTATPAVPAGLVPGATVTLKGGQKVTVTKVNPDGSFEYK